MAVRKGGFIDFRQNSPTGTSQNLLSISAVTTSVAAQVDTYTANGYTVMLSQLGAGVSLSPQQKAVAAAAAGGWLLPCSAANNLGILVDLGQVSDATAPYCFKVGTDPAFQCTWTFSVGTHTGCLLAGCGFRTAGDGNGGVAGQGTDALTADWVVANLTAASAVPYADIAYIGTESADVFTAAKAASASISANTDSTLVETDATVVTYKMLVSSAGAITVQRNGLGNITTASGAVGALGSFAAATIVQPYFVFKQTAGGTSTCILQSVGWGYQ